MAENKMGSKPLVSGIIIFLNAEKFIQEAINSVFAQTYDNWELLLVDDGSTDSSTAIALHYAQQFPEKVRYLEHEGHQNRGMSAARNLGIRNARGEYIAFLDADDVWLPHKLAQQVVILNSQPEAAMLYGRTQYWNSWTGNPKDIDGMTALAVEPNSLVKPPTLLTRFLQNENIYPCTCSILVRREVFENIGKFEETFRDTYEDMVFHSKVFLKAPVFVANQCWDRYRLHPNNSWKTALTTGQYHPVDPNPARRAYLTWLEEYLLKQEIEGTEEVWQALQKELWPYRHPMLYRLVEPPQRLAKQVKGRALQIGRQTLPVSIRRWLRAKFQGDEYCPPVVWVRFGSLRRLTPISQEFGYDRGLPIDRYYIENFLARHTNDIQGRVLEVGEASYTQQFGGDRVIQSDVLHVLEGNPEATFVGDLTSADHIPSNAFDCIIVTQTLHLIYDVRAALKTLYRILKPGGFLLTTFPGISQISNDEWGDYWCWGFTTLSARRLFEEVFLAAQVQIEAHGNVLAATAFLHGLATQELRREELDYFDPDYEVLITVRAVKEVMV